MSKEVLMAASFTIDQRVRHTVAGRARLGRIIRFLADGMALVAWDGGNATPVRLTDLEAL